VVGENKKGEMHSDPPALGGRRRYLVHKRPKNIGWIQRHLGGTGKGGGGLGIRPELNHLQQTTGYANHPRSQGSRSGAISGKWKAGGKEKYKRRIMSGLMRFASSAVRNCPKKKVSQHANRS